VVQDEGANAVIFEPINRACRWLAKRILPGLAAELIDACGRQETNQEKQMGAIKRNWGLRRPSSRGWPPPTAKQAINGRSKRH
jgi:hypothetical protein